MPHGENGWVLVEYDWDPETGIGTCVYETGKGIPPITVTLNQPSDPRHAGWARAWYEFVHMRR